jgi:hypothetical protein
MEELPDAGYDDRNFGGEQMAAKADFESVFVKLKAILEPYASKLVVTVDGKTGYSLDTCHVIRNKKRVFFASVRIGKGYVSFHLMPIYCFPELFAAISPELKKRMQGKSCFNFKTVDEKLLKELGKLTKAGFAKFQDKKFLASL